MPCLHVKCHIIQNVTSNKVCNWQFNDSLYNVCLINKLPLLPFISLILICNTLLIIYIGFLCLHTQRKSAIRTVIEIRQTHCVEI